MIATEPSADSNVCGDWCYARPCQLILCLFHANWIETVVEWDNNIRQILEMQAIWELFGVLMTIVVCVSS